MDSGDQRLADIAREVEVDVRDVGELLVEKAPEEESRAHWIDVREAGQITDDRADARAPAAARRQHPTCRVGPAHLARDLARQLEQVSVEAKEAGEAKLADHPELLVEASARLLPLGHPGVTAFEAPLAQLRQLAVGLLVLGARIAIAVVAPQIELEALG
jgi:hypothetical protein